MLVPVVYRTCHDLGVIITKLFTPVTYDTSTIRTTTSTKNKRSVSLLFGSKKNLNAGFGWVLIRSVEKRNCP